MTIFVAVIMVLVLGVVSFSKMTPDLMPNMDLPYAVVLTTYIGQTPETVETTVTKPTEQSLSVIDGVKQIRSASSDNYSMCMIEFQDGTDMNTATVDVRSALDVFDYRGPNDAAALGQSCIPKLTAAQVQNAVESLLQLELVHTRKDGRTVPTEAHLKTMEHWLSASISEYQKSIAELARNSIANTPKENRDISTLTMALDSSQIEKIRNILADTRKAIVNVVNAMPPQVCDSVYQLNFQLFPMMKKED